MKKNQKKEENQDFEVRSLDTICVNESHLSAKKENKIKYFFLGIVFGFLLIKAEVTSWYRIQEMFRFSSFHLYGVIGMAVVTGALGVFLLKKFKIKTLQGEKIEIHPKKFHYGQIFGGFLFGLGWGMIGACPGPIFVQIGAGVSSFLIVFASAVFGTWLYGLWRERLIH